MILRPFIFTENLGCHSKDGNGYIQKSIKKCQAFIKI